MTGEFSVASALTVLVTQEMTGEVNVTTALLDNSALVQVTQEMTPR